MEDERKREASMLQVNVQLFLVENPYPGINSTLLTLFFVFTTSIYTRHWQGFTQMFYDVHVSSH